MATKSTHSSSHLDTARELFREKKGSKIVLEELKLHAIERFNSLVNSNAQKEKVEDNKKEIDPTALIDIFHVLNANVLDYFRNHQTYRDQLIEGCKSSSIWEYDRSIDRRVVRHLASALIRNAEKSKEPDTIAIYRLVQGACWIYQCVVDTDIFEWE